MNCFHWVDQVPGKKSNQSLYKWLCLKKDVYKRRNKITERKPEFSDNWTIGCSLEPFPCLPLTIFLGDLGKLLNTDFSQAAIIFWILSVLVVLHICPYNGMLNAPQANTSSCYSQLAQVSPGQMLQLEEKVPLQIFIQNGCESSQLHQNPRGAKVKTDNPGEC